MPKLRIGRINYANVFPIYYTLEREFDCSGYEFIEGVPSYLNRMLRAGSIDLSPSSSVEYLRNRTIYNILDGVSISSKGPVGSVFLFSKKPIEALDGSLISLTSQSETSVALLAIIIRRFYGIDCRFERSSTPGARDADAFLMIGDDALKYKAKLNDNNSILRDPSGLPDFRASVLAYDLGEIWYQRTGVPFVFALWIVRKELFDPADPRHPVFNKYVRDLNSAKEIALKNLPEIARHSPLKAFMSEKAIIEYWKNLDYDLSEEHKKGLQLFDEYIV
jgi:chorismate dehydratase